MADEALTHPSPESQARSTTEPPTASPKRRGSRILKILGITLGIVLILIALLPFLVSTFVLRGRLQSTLSETLGAPTTVAAASFSWLDGVHVAGLRVANPPGFASDAPAIELAELSGDFGFWQLLRGRFDLQGRVRGLEINVVQRADGAINLEQLGDKSARSETPTTSDPDEGSLDDMLARSRLDLALEGAIVRIVSETLGPIEEIHDLTAKVVKPFGSSDVKLELGADLGKPAAAGEARGRFDLVLDADATFERPARMQLDCRAIDLARYAPLLSARAPEQVTAFAGRVEGSIRAEGHPQRTIAIDGNLDVRDPHFAGPMFFGLDVRAPLWTVRPVVRADLGGATPSVDTSGFDLDLGFLRVRGIPAARTTELTGEAAGFGASFDVDLQQIVSFAQAIVPAGLSVEGARLRGEIALATPDGLPTTASLETLLGQLGLQANLTLARLQVADRVLENLDARATVAADGSLEVVTADGAKLDGGSLGFRATADLAKLDEVPLDIQAQIDGASASGSSVDALQFAVPLLAGIAPDAASIDFRSLLKLQLGAHGPILPGPEQGVLEWLEGWTGQGQLALAQGSFTPAPALAGLLELLGQQGKLAFEQITTSFALDAGAITSDAVQFANKGREFGLRGRTTLRGALDYSFDVAALLRGHRDGERILKYVDPKTLSAGLTGTIDAPKLQLPSVEALLQNAAEAALRDAANKQLDPLKQKAQEELQRALRGLFGDKK